MTLPYVITKTVMMTFKIMMMMIMKKLNEKLSPSEKGRVKIKR